MSKIYILSPKQYAGAENLPVIVFDYFDKEIDLSPYDALIFTSKNGVLALEEINPLWRSKEIYSIGSGTTRAVKALGGNVVYEARSSYGDNFAEEIKTHLAGKKVLFLCPKVVTSHLNTILRDAGVDLDEEVIYETKCNDCEKLHIPEKGSYIIFSSPSTIECFFKCFTWDESYTAIVIGEKTASYMPEAISFVMSPKQTIDACIAVAEQKSNISSKN
jgi:uroporphyrinogen-III synthase